MRCPTIVLSIAVLSMLGCSGSDAPPSTNGAGNPTRQASAKPSGGDANHAAAASATAFLNAIAQGDEATAFGRLTPMAAEQMSRSGKRFAFSAVDTAQFEVTRVWQPQTDEAAVQFHMTAQAEGETVSFEVCCFMRSIEGDWRLGGIAYDLGDGQEPVVVNYEAGPQPQPAVNSVQTVDTAPAGEKTPQTAQNPEGTLTR